MGDTGSLTLGFSLAFLAISFSMNNHNIKPFFEGAIVSAFATLAVPVLDVARVMFVRVVNGKSVFHPDRNHIHHKFLSLGFSHRISMIYIVGIAIFFSLFNIILVQFISNNIVLALDALIWIGFHYGIHQVELSRNLKQSRLRKQTAKLSRSEV